MQISEELASLALRDPLAFGITYVDLLEQRKWEVDSRRWIIEPYQILNPWMIEKYPVGLARKMSIMKSTQSGISTLGLVKMFHFTSQWDVRVFYTLPRQQDTIDMVSTRVDPMIHNSPYLKEKKGLPDSTHAKRIGNSYIFFMELSVEPRMQPADMLIVDEVDLSDQDYMSTAQNRLDASRWKIQLFMSTPTVSNWGIHNMYMHSDQRKWMFKCPKCAHSQVMDWEQTIKVVGNPSDPEDVYYGCIRCDTRISIEQVQTGEWVAMKPSLSDEHVGYHISQMMTTPADILWKLWRDPQTRLSEFYRKRLGVPYEIGGGSLSREDFLVNAFTEPYDEELMYEDTSSAYYMGVDQGNELQVLVGKVDRDNPHIIKIVHAELVDPVSPSNSDPSDYGFSRIGKLMRMFKIKRCVIDGDPNRHDALSLQKDYPGRVIVADYVEHKEESKKKKDKKTGITTNLTINRTIGFDNLFEAIKHGRIQLYGSATHLPQLVNIIIDQVTALKRDVETRKTRSGTTEVAVYRKIRADHFAHAGVYLMQAVNLDKSGMGKVVVLGLEEEESEEDTRASGWRIIVKNVTNYLAEVPKDQLEDYLKYHDDPTWEQPFPLSFKMKVTLTEFSKEDTLRVIESHLT